jgi:hypothetical protein
MRKLIVVSTLALSVIAAACDKAADTPTAPPQQQPSTSTGGPAVASARGGGTATTADGSTYRFAFAAAVDNDGSTKGDAMLRIGDTRYNADVTCLGVRGDTAVIVGVVRSSSDPAAVGDSLVFTAIDGNDRISEPEFPASGPASDAPITAQAAAGARCASVIPGATLAVDAGEVTVSGSTFTGPVVVGTVVGLGSYIAINGDIPANFEINVTRLSDGTVSGEYREQILDGEVNVITVSCVTFSGDTAYIGVTVNGDPSLGEGGVVVVDNAPSTNPDQIGFNFESAQDTCNGAVPEVMKDLASGDIAITP